MTVDRKTLLLALAALGDRKAESMLKNELGYQGVPVGNRTAINALRKVLQQIEEARPHARVEMVMVGEGKTPREAAEDAWDSIMSDPGFKPYLTVIMPDGTEEDVDLEEEGPDAEEAQ